MAFSNVKLEGVSSPWSLPARPLKDIQKSRPSPCSWRAWPPLENYCTVEDAASVGRLDGVVSVGDLEGAAFFGRLEGVASVGQLKDLASVGRLEGVASVGQLHRRPGLCWKAGGRGLPWATRRGGLC